MSLENLMFSHRYTFTYTNHKNETETRTVEPAMLQYGTVEPYYPEPEWLLCCWDLDRVAYRTFSLKKIKDMKLV